jgi:hypothetical protein
VRAVQYDDVLVEGERWPGYVHVAPGTSSTAPENFAAVTLTALGPRRIWLAHEREPRDSPAGD